MNDTLVDIALKLPGYINIFNSVRYGIINFETAETEKFN